MNNYCVKRREFCKIVSKGRVCWFTTPIFASVVIVDLYLT
jgi:hypothetical protein